MKNREKQLVKNTLIVAIGQISTKFIGFFLLPFYTSLLSAKEYGIVDLLNTFVALIIPIAFLQIDQAVFRFLIDARNNKKEETKIISTIFFTIIIQLLIYMFIYLIFGRFIHNEYKHFLLLNVIVIMSSSVLLQISRGMGDNLTYSIGSLISGLGTIIFNVIFISEMELGADGMLLATLIANIICSIFVFLKLKLYIFIKISFFCKNKLKEILKYSVPLIPNQLSWWVINTSDRVIITSILGITLNGIYSAANKISSMLITIFNIFNMTWSESAALHFKDSDNSEYFSKIMNMIINFFTYICLIIISTMPFIFKYLITGEEYSDAYFQIPILLLSTIFSIVVSLFGSIYVALKKTKEIAKTSFYAAIINILINFILIKYIGLYAASLSTFISYLAMAIYRYCDIKKYIKIKLEKKDLLINIFISIFVILIYYLKVKFISLIILIILLIYFIMNNKFIFESFVKKIHRYLKKNLL